MHAPNNKTNEYFFSSHQRISDFLKAKETKNMAMHTVFQTELNNSTNFPTSQRTSSWRSVKLSKEPLNMLLQLWNLLLSLTLSPGELTNLGR